MGVVWELGGGCNGGLFGGCGEHSLAPAQDVDDGLPCAGRGQAGAPALLQPVHSVGVHRGDGRQHLQAQLPVLLLHALVRVRLVHHRRHRRVLGHQRQQQHHKRPQAELYGGVVGADGAPFRRRPMEKGMGMGRGRLP